MRSVMGSCRHAYHRPDGVADSHANGAADENNVRNSQHGFAAQKVGEHA